MAITRRQFVTTLGALAAAMGIGQAEISSITEAFGHNVDYDGSNTAISWVDKPKVVWVHGAECTGCSTSLLSLFEDVTGTAIEGMSYSTLAALDLAVGGTGNGNAVLQTATSAGGQAGHPYGHRTVHNTADVTGLDFDNKLAVSGGTAYVANIADVLIDFIDLQYHETVMGMGGDLAYQWLADNMYNGSATPFVMVVEGAVQDKTLGGYWNATGDIAWCSIGKDQRPGVDFVTNASATINNDGDHSFDDVVARLAAQANCLAIVAIGQCATYGGYPAAVSPVLKAAQTGATGVKSFLGKAGRTGAAKVINVPGCPANPWWFVLTVVAWMVDFASLQGKAAGTSGTLGILTATTGMPAINGAAVDKAGRLKAVYPSPIHGPACPRYQDFLNGKFVTTPGEHYAGSKAGGCLQLIGCKGPSTKALCNVHGWNSFQPRNNAAWEQGINQIVSGKGTSCVMAGHPCMGCSEPGYPDAFVPFVAR